MQALPSSSLPSPAPAKDADGVLRARVQDASERFEALFIHQMLKSMRQSGSSLAGEDALFKRDADSPLLELADQLLADKLAGQRAFGIADLLLRQLQPLNAAPAGAALSVQTDAAARGAEDPR